MTTRDTLIHEILMNNGLTIYFHDRSKSLVAGRWQAHLAVRVPVALTPELFADLPDAGSAHTEYTNLHGHQIVFTVDKVRHFVAEAELQTTLDQLAADFLSTNLPYLSHPSFSRRFVLRKYRSWKEKQSLDHHMAEASPKPL